MQPIQNLCILALLLVGVSLTQVNSFSVGYVNPLHDAALDSGAQHANVGARQPRQFYSYQIPGGYVQGGTVSGPGYGYSSHSVSVGSNTDYDY